ncbi:MAG: GNAT family N-acetyltransferase [Steroidobacteraceae bacterium]
MAGSVRNNTAEERYELELDGVIAYVAYHHEDGYVSLDHTEVPSQLGGRGVGSALAKGTLDLIRSEGFKLIPRCDFIAGYIKKHPEYQDLVANAR